MSKFYSSNMNLLAQRNPSLAGLVHNTDLDDAFEMLQTESGHFTVRRHAQDGTYRFIHSQVNPISEARFWADCQNVHPDHAIILGIGLAYQVEQLLHAFPDCKAIWLIEVDRSLFRLAMTVVDMSTILSNPKVHLWGDEGLLSFESFSYHPFLPAMALHPERYDSIILSLEQQLYQMRFHSRGNEDGNNVLPIFGGVEVLLDAMRA